MEKHYFSYRKMEHGRPTDIQIEVIIARGNKEDARRIADEEIKALTAGHSYQETTHQRLRTKIQRIERTAVLPLRYFYQGSN
jgi:hypothetical protein